MVFRRWSNRKWAILASFHKVIIIGTLCLSYQILAQDNAVRVADSSGVHILVELEEVETTGEMPADLEAVSLKPLIVITSRDISAAAVTSHEEMLDYLPQLDIRHRGRHGTQADLTIQGGSFDQSLVLLNGIDISDPQTGHFHLNLPLDLNSIQQVEVVTGSASRRYGTNAFSGAVNMITHPADSTFFNAGFRYGQHQFYKAHLKTNVSGDFVSTLISVNTSGSKGYRENTDFKTTHAFIHTSTRPGKMKAHVMIGMNKRAFGANSFYSPRFVNQYEETTTGLTAIKLVLQESRSEWNFNSYLKLNRDHFLLDRHDPSFYKNDHLTKVAGADLNGRISTAAGITYSGLHYRREQINSTSLGELLDPEAAVEYNDSITFTHGHIRNQMNWNVNHTYEQGRFTFSGGFLVHLNSDLDFKPTVFPGIDIRLKLPAFIQFYTSVNQSMRLPTFTDLYYTDPSNVGNPQLKPEKATSFELGLYRVGNGLQVGINGFYRKGSEMIDWIWMNDEKWHAMNLTRIDAAGGDIRLRYEQDHGKTAFFTVETTELSYTFTHLSRVSPGVNSRYLLDNLRHKVVLGTGLSFARKFLFSLKATCQDRNGTFLAFNPKTGQSSEQTYEPFLVADIKVAYAPGPILIFLEATNLFDASYNDIGNIMQPGRWIMAGFEIR